MRQPISFFPLSPANHIHLVSYKEWLAQQGMTAHSQRVYHSRVKQFLLFLEYTRLSEHTDTDSRALQDSMKMYLKFLRETKASASSINAYVNALNNFSHFLGLTATELRRVPCYPKAA